MWISSADRWNVTSLLRYLPQPINEANKGTPEIWPIVCVVHKSDGIYYAGWLSIKNYMEMLFCEWPVFVFAVFPTCSLVGGGFLSLMIASNRTIIKTKNNVCCFFCVRICIFGLNMTLKLQTSFFNGVFLYVLSDLLPSCLEKYAPEALHEMICSSKGFFDSLRGLRRNVFFFERT